MAGRSRVGPLRKIAELIENETTASIDSVWPSLACLCSPLFAATATAVHKNHASPLPAPALDVMESHVPPVARVPSVQNAEIDRLELPRIQDDDELEALKASGALQPIIAGETLRFDPRLDPSRRYCRPWTRDFVQDIAQAYYNRFHEQIQVNSAVRTVKVQKKLRRHNRNAAPAEGDTASSHLAGLTVDLQRRGMTQGTDSLDGALPLLHEGHRPG